MLSWMEGMEYISGFNAGNGFDNGFKISPVFADNTILFCDAVRYQLLQDVAGLKFNLNKSEVVKVGYIDRLEELASLLM